MVADEADRLRTIRVRHGAKAAEDAP